MKVSVSYLSVKKRLIPKAISILDKTSMDYLHVDVMDGKYVRNKANLYSDVEKLSYLTRKRMDIHFMVNKPLKMIDDFASLNVFCMTFHANIKNKLDDVIAKCQSYGIKVGIAIRPEEDVDIILPYLDKIDLVLVMSVIPGRGGQEFMEEVLPKIKLLRELFKKEKKNILISIDGGVNADTKKLIHDVDIIVSGNYVTSSENYEEAIKKLR